MGTPRHLDVDNSFLKSKKAFGFACMCVCVCQKPEFSRLSVDWTMEKSRAILGLAFLGRSRMACE